MRNPSRDLALVVFLTLVALLVPLKPPVNIPFDLLLVLYQPGYALLTAVFPTWSLVWPEVYVYSLGMSLALTAIVGLALHLSGWGIRSDSLATLLGGITLASAGVAWFRRRRSEASQLQGIARQSIAGGFLFAISIAFLALAMLVAHSPTSPDGFDGYTLLWIEAGEPGSHQFQIGVQSHEFSTVAYRLELLAGGEQFETLPGFMLRPGEEQEIPLNWPDPLTSLEPVEVQLFRLDNPRTPYRQVVLWPGGVTDGWK